MKKPIKPALKKMFASTVALFVVLLLTGQSCNVTNLTKPADGGVFKSKDGAETWVQTTRIDDKTSISKANITVITIDPLNVDTIYAGSSSGGLYKTDNGGKNWTPLGIPAARIDRIVVKPGDSKTIYVSGNGSGFGKIFKSTDGGQTWTDAYTDPVSASTIDALDVDPAATNTVYAGTGSNGIIKSTDGGENWTLLEWSVARVSDMRVDPRKTDRLYIATADKGFYRSDNGGKTIDHVSIDEKKFPQANQISDFSLDVNSADTLYVVSKYGLLKSTDAGSNWSAITTLVPRAALPIKTVIIDPKNSRTLYVSTINTLYKSTDGGASWAVKELPTTRTISVLTINPANTDFIYLGLLFEK